MRFDTCVQELRQALLELQTNLMVANSTFMHTSLQIMVFSLLPPPGPPPGPTAGERWQPSPEALAVQEEVLQELIRVSAGAHMHAASWPNGTPHNMHAHHASPHAAAADTPLPLTYNLSRSLLTAPGVPFPAGHGAGAHPGQRAAAAASAEHAPQGP
jgi:hypothetical protein